MQARSRARRKTALDKRLERSRLAGGMSKNFSITAVLVALLLLVTVLFGAFVLTHVCVDASVRAFYGYERALETQIVMVTRNRAVFQAMVNDAREYAKKSPAMASLLQQYAPSLEQLELQNKPSTPAAPSASGR